MAEIDISLGAPDESAGQARLVNAMKLAGGDEKSLPTLTKTKTKDGIKLVTFFGNSFVAQPTGFVKPFQLLANDVAELVNAGIGGNTTQMMLDRLSDVPVESDIVLLYESNNNSGTGVNPAQHAADVKGLITEMQNAGHQVIYVLGSPADDLSKSALTHDYRFYDWVTCRDMNVPCFDIWTEFANNDGTGFWMAGFSEDGTHPTRASYKQGGEVLARKYNEQEPGYPLQIRNDLGPLSNALFIDDTNADGVPDGFVANQPASVSLSQTTLGIGNTLTVSFSNAQSFVRTNAFALETGKSWAFALRFSCSFSAVVDGRVQIFLVGASDNQRRYLLESCSTSIDDTTLYAEFESTDPDGYLLYAEMNGEDYTATFNIAQLTLWCIDDYTVPDSASYSVNGQIKTF